MVDNKVVIVDCSCVVIARGDDRLVGVSLLAAICIAASAVGVQVAVWVYLSMEVVVMGLVWVLKLVVWQVVGPIWTASSILTSCSCVCGSMQLPGP